ncbi:MAG: hypothetical protein ACRD6N_11215, partial [Pyrinomonadaceae bacterium]
MVEFAGCVAGWFGEKFKGPDCARQAENDHPRISKTKKPFAPREKRPNMLFIFTTYLLLKNCLSGFWLTALIHSERIWVDWLVAVTNLKQKMACQLR